MQRNHPLPANRTRSSQSLKPPGQPVGGETEPILEPKSFHHTKKTSRMDDIGLHREAPPSHESALPSDSRYAAGALDDTESETLVVPTASKSEQRAVGTLNGAAITLGCFLFGDKEPFMVSVKLSEPVDRLKDVIKAKLTPKLDDVAANDLTLWNVSIPYSDCSGIRIEDFNENGNMAAFENLSFYFKRDGLKTKHIHIVVRRPEAQTHALTVSTLNQIQEEIRMVREKMRPPSDASISLSNFNIRQSPFEIIEFPPLRDVDRVGKFISFPWDNNLVESQEEQTISLHCVPL
ncbi:hypothetical protein M427DRAFT_180240 [Gonapodya prolifera JEL478]|uniref:Crinkler effector protein N-terminal domain-containing protein n=1 Tax=Gonapodya prolifera (strain JEL478) TaxID=1344416 RepID=A0A139AR10_GONPJ|nr:hypothetical protein M427DRAFT_180240 [Gonapodya prolifera JEL478]|eukprot:KXS18953.1 hypothetical protein M427DRAFT_180240 [Gonapodya prolifera JEL478]